MSRSLGEGPPFKSRAPKSKSSQTCAGLLCTRVNRSSCQHNQPGPLNLRLSFWGDSLSCQPVLTDRKHPELELLCSDHLWGLCGPGAGPEVSPVTSNDATMLRVASLSCSCISSWLPGCPPLSQFTLKGHSFPKQPACKMKRPRRQRSQPGRQAAVRVKGGLILT